MASDNGKAGEIDWYDVWGTVEYIERKYNGSIEINLSATSTGSRSGMLLCASFVGNEPIRPRGAAGSVEIPFAPGSMRQVPRLAHELLFELQETVDDLPPGRVVLTY